MINELTLSLEKALYEREAILACVQLFQNESDVSVSGGDGGNVTVSFSGTDTAALEELAKRFRAELVRQQVRRDLNVQFGELREMIVQQAFSPITVK